MHVRLKRLLVLGPTALVVVFGLALFEANRRVVSTLRQIDETRQAENVLDDISLELVRAARVRDAFISAPDPAPLRGMQAAVEDLGHTLDRLHGVLSAPLPEHRQLVAVDSLVHAQAQALSDEVEQARSTSLDAAASAMAAGASGPGVQAVQRVVRSMLHRETGLFDERVASERDFTQFILWLIIGGTLVSVGSSLIVLRMLDRDTRAREVDRRRIAESEQRFRAAFEQAAVGVSQVALDHYYVAANERFCRIVGYGENELRSMTFRDLTHPDDVDADVQNVNRLVAGEIRSFHNEKRYIRKDGRTVWVNLYVSLVRDADDVPQYFIAVTEDLTERRQAEQALRDSQAQLLQAQKMEALGRLAGGVAHDFNNLLTVINGHARMALELDGRDDDLHQVIDTADRAAALTRQLLAFSRKSMARPSIADLNDVVRHTLTMLRRLIGEDVTLVTELAPDELTVRADTTQLEQVILNLAVNARDAMPDGGTLTLSTGRREDHDRRTQSGAQSGAASGAGITGNGLTAPGITSDGPTATTGASGGYRAGWAVLSIRDTGQGMDDETAQHIFEPFFTTKEQGRGTGLGLSTVLGIVEQAGGHIDVASEPGTGTAFSIELPLSGETLAPHPQQQPEPATLLHDGAERVLLVEDEPGVRRLLERILADAGYVVRSAQDGQAALDVADDVRPHLVLSDIVMPGIDGPGLATRLRERGSKCRFLFMSGYTVQNLDGLLDSEHVSFIEKPFTPESLLTAVRDALDR